MVFFKKPCEVGWAVSKKKKKKKKEKEEFLKRAERGEKERSSGCGILGFSPEL